MAITSARVTVGAAAVALNAAENDLVSGANLVVKNQDATNSVSLGNISVTAATGYELKPGQTVELHLSGGELLYAIRIGVADVRCDVISS